MIANPTDKIDTPEVSPSSADGRAERAASRAGIEKALVEQLPFDLSALEDEGLFVNVDARGFGLLDRRLDWEALGISLPKQTDVAFRSPRCGLLPDRYRLPLLRPAAKAHDALNRYSYRFTLTETLFETPAYRWVPWRAFPEFEREYKAAEAALTRERETVLGDYDSIREEVVSTFLRLAEDSARRLQATGHLIPEGFESAVVDGVLRVFPSAEDLRKKLILRYQVGVILLGSEMLQEQRKAREERRKLEQAEAELQIERRRQEARTRLVQVELWAEEERLRRNLEAEAEEQKREAEVKERIRRLKLEAAKERLEEALSPIEEGAKQLHAAVYEAALAIRESLQKHRYLPGGSVRRAKELSRWFALMNWQSDEKLESLLKELESLAARPKGNGKAKAKKEPQEIEEILSDIISLTYSDARELSRPNRMAALEI